jgi:hypothetical protein
MNKKNIVLFGRCIDNQLSNKADYLSARRLAGKKGMRLPSNVLHDEYLVNPERLKGVAQIYPAWARELLVYPERDGKFALGKDIVDSETGWCLPVVYLTNPHIVDTDVFRESIGLFVEPADIVIEGDRTIVHPASIVVLHPFIQENGAWGPPDKNTRIPLSYEIDDNGGSKRWLKRIEGVGVRPIVRAGEAHNWMNISSNCKPDSLLGMSGEV